MSEREKSCGAVLFMTHAGQRLYLVLHSVKGHWTLCKGHVEGTETELQTARREIKEETGLQVSFIDGFRQVISYQPAPQVDKDVVFFLASTDGLGLICQPEEISEACFMPFDQAMRRLTHASDQQVLMAAEAFVKG